MPPMCDMTWSHTARGGVINTSGEGISPSDMVRPPWRGSAIGIVPYHIYVNRCAPWSRPTAESGCTPLTHGSYTTGPGLWPGLRCDQTCASGRLHFGLSLAEPSAPTPREWSGHTMTRPDSDSRPLLRLRSQLLLGGENLKPRRPWACRGLAFVIIPAVAGR